MPAIQFVNEQKSLEVLPGMNLHTAALKSGIALYSPIQRLLHLNVNIGPIKFPCGSDIVEIVDGKGTNSRSPEEEKIISGRFLIKRKVLPVHRLACQVQVTGDVTVRTRPKLEVDVEETKVKMGYYLIFAVFTALMLLTLALIGLDLVRKI